MFKEIRVINRKCRVDRRLKMTYRLKDLGYNYSFITATEGKLFFTTQFMTATCHAIFQSHIKANADRNDNVLILEDDVILVDNFNERYNEAIKQLPSDWDILYLGFTPILNKEDFTKVNDNFVKLNNYCSGAWAYIINIKHKDLLYNLPYNCPYDDALKSLQSHMNCYSFMPFLAYIDNDYSDNSQEFSKWDFSKYL